MKINVLGDIGNNAKIALLNLDDITEVQLPNGQIAYLLWLSLNLLLNNLSIVMLLFSISY